MRLNHNCIFTKYFINRLAKKNFKFFKNIIAFSSIWSSNLTSLVIVNIKISENKEGKNQ